MLKTRNDCVPILSQVLKNLGKFRIGQAKITNFFFFLSISYFFFYWLAKGIFTGEFNLGGIFFGRFISAGKEFSTDPPSFLGLPIWAPPGDWELKIPLRFPIQIKFPLQQNFPILFLTIKQQVGGSKKFFNFFLVINLFFGIFGNIFFSFFFFFFSTGRNICNR